MKKKNYVAIGLISSFALWGVLEALADNRVARLSSVLSVVHALLISICIFWWARLDRREAGERLTRGWGIALILLGMATMPFYLFKHRPRERRWISIAKGFGLVVLALLLYVSTYVLTGMYDVPG